MKPTRTAKQLPDFLLSEYSEAMRCGTLMRLMAMSAMPWTNVPMATAYRQEWQRHLSFAGYQSDVGNTRQQLRVKSWG